MYNFITPQARNYNFLEIAVIEMFLYPIQYMISPTLKSIGRSSGAKKAWTISKRIFSGYFEFPIEFD